MIKPWGKATVRSWDLEDDTSLDTEEWSTT